MRKLFTAFALAMLLPASFTANAKDDDKKDKKKPVKLTVYDWIFPWPPVYRLVPMDEALDSNTFDCTTLDCISVESECE